VADQTIVLQQPAPFPEQVSIQPIETQRESVTTVVPGPGEVQQMGTAAGAQRAVAPAIAAQGEADAEAMRAKAIAHEDVSVAERLAAQDIADRMEAHQQRRQLAQASYDQAAKELETHQFHDFWADKGTGQKVLALLGASLGGFQSGMTGGPNFAMQQINGAIAQDFAMQRARLSSKEHVAELRRRGVQDVDEQLERDLAALELKEAHARRAAASMGEAIAVRAGIPVAQAKSDVLVAQQNAEAEQVNLRALQRFEQHATKMHEKSQTVVRSRGAGTSAAAKNLSPLTIYGAGGVPIGDAQTPKQADEINSASEAYRNLREKLLQLKTDMEQNGAVLPFGVSDAGARRETITGEITGLLKKQEQLGTLDLGVERLVKGIIGGPVTGTLGRGAPKLDEAIKTLDAKHGNLLEQKGFRGGTALVPKIHGGGGGGGPAAPGGAPTTAAPGAGEVRTPGSDVRSAAPARAARPPAALYNRAIEALRANSGATAEERAAAERIRADFERAGG
jgi:hypothetical protein